MENRTCKQCGKEFEITDEEIKFMEGKNLELPKRCKECRKENKAKYRKKKKENAQNRANAKMSYEENKKEKVKAALNGDTAIANKNGSNKNTINKNNTNKNNPNKKHSNNSRKNYKGNNYNRNAQNKFESKTVVNNEEENNITVFKPAENKKAKVKKYAIRLVIGIFLLIVIAFIAGAFSGI